MTDDLTGGKPPTIPHPPVFRAWLMVALEETGARRSAVSLATGKGKNTVSAFLRDEDRGIDLGRAAKIERHLRQVAAGQGKVLPDVRPDALNGRGLADE